MFGSAQQKQQSPASNSQSIYQEPPRFTHSNGFKAAVGVAVLGGFLGLIAFSYQQAQDEPSSLNLATIEAPTPYTRIKPEDPMGMQVPNQDKLIYSHIDPEGVAAPMVERLMPPAETPLMPSELAARQQQEMQRTETIQLEKLQAAAPLAQPAKPDVAAAIEPVQAAPRLTAAPTSSQPPVVATPATESAAPATTPQAVQAKPVEKTAEPVAKTAAKSATQAAALPKASTTGTFRLQLASLGDKAKAEQAWNSIKSKNSDIASLPHYIVAADITGRGTFYRVQVGGWNERSAADAWCARLKTAGQACLVARR